MVKLNGLSNILSQFYGDNMKVYRKTTVTNSDGTTGFNVSNTPVTESACRVSYSSPDKVKLAEYKYPIKIEIEIFCPLGTDIKKGDKVIVQKFDDNDVIATYTGLISQPSLYPSHIQFYLEQEGTA